MINKCSPSANTHQKTYPIMSFNWSAQVHIRVICARLFCLQCVKVETIMRSSCIMIVQWTQFRLGKHHQSLIDCRHPTNCPAFWSPAVFYVFPIFLFVFFFVFFWMAVGGFWQFPIHLKFKLRNRNWNWPKIGCAFQRLFGRSVFLVLAICFGPFDMAWHSH